MPNEHVEHAIERLRAVSDNLNEADERMVAGHDATAPLWRATAALEGAVNSVVAVLQQQLGVK